MLHQRKAAQYCLKQEHPFLAMEMRLGKCVVAIRRIIQYKPLDPWAGLKVLIACPSEAIQGWVDELTVEGHLEDTLVLAGRKDRKEIFEYEKSNKTWFIINKEGFLVLPEIATWVNWDSVIIDESFIRNEKSKVTKFFTKNFRDCPHRWLLTGTPNPESDLELFPQLKWLDGYAFGFSNYWDFRASSFTVRAYDWVPKPGVKKFIHEYLGKRAFIMNRKAAGIQVNKVIQRRIFQLPLEIRKIYDECEKNYELQGISTIWETVKYQWLRQLTGGHIDGRVVWEGKLHGLISLLTGELKNSQVVVWFNYNREIYEVQQRLVRLGIYPAVITGAIGRVQRSDNRRSFQSGQTRIILCQEMAVQMGVDLSAADTAIYFSRNPSAITDRQTEDRIVHLAKTGTLLYIYLLTENSVDEDLFSAMNLKRLKSNLSLNSALRAAMKARVYKSNDITTHSGHQIKILNRLQAKR